MFVNCWELKRQFWAKPWNLVKNFLRINQMLKKYLQEPNQFRMSCTEWTWVPISTLVWTNIPKNLVSTKINLGLITEIWTEVSVWLWGRSWLNFDHYLFHGCWVINKKVMKFRRWWNMLKTNATRFNIPKINLKLDWKLWCKEELIKFWLLSVSWWLRNYQNSDKILILMKNFNTI